MVEALLAVSGRAWNNSCISKHGLLSTFPGNAWSWSLQGGWQSLWDSASSSQTLQPHGACHNLSVFPLLRRGTSLSLDLSLPHSGICIIPVGGSPWRQRTCCSAWLDCEVACILWNTVAGLWKMPVAISCPDAIESQWELGEIPRMIEQPNTTICSYKLFFCLAQWSAQNGSQSKAEDYE